ncbi:unnamed protein product [Strongylus vulgaris]|uniref:Uncharacterized protein n=1 Tax=Strongylus vulgaris TaxID=40348 RepID=A0A3P7K1F9_STRVU|nr:unnamed protein product [Strongylus vulgaris]
MKECISEQDHYHSFPNKGYAIDEECDLVEVQGQEVAYCLCRNQNLCNKSPIADQFVAFEERFNAFQAKQPKVESEIRRAQLPMREKQPEFPDTPIAAEVGNGVGFIGNVGGNRQAVAIPSPPATPPIVKPLKTTAGNSLWVNRFCTNLAFIFTLN